MDYKTTYVGTCGGVLTVVHAMFEASNDGTCRRIVQDAVWRFKGREFKIHYVARDVIPCPTDGKEDLIFLGLNETGHIIESVDLKAGFKPVIERAPELADNDEPSDDDLIQMARDQYADDDLEIDVGAAVSRGDEGAWVQAWVWVPYPAEETDEKEAA